MAVDLVCNMQVNENNPDTLRFEYKGVTFYFCTPLCLAQFEVDPERFIKESKNGDQKRKHKGKGNPEVS